MMEKSKTADTLQAPRQSAYGLAGLFSYSVVGQEGAESHYRLEVDGAHGVFRGHFPDFKIVPGVCLLQMLACCLSDHLGRPVEWVSIPNCKFTAPVRPETSGLLDLYFSLPRAGRVQARMLCAGSVVASMKIDYQECGL